MRKVYPDHVVQDILQTFYLYDGDLYRYPKSYYGPAFRVVGHLDKGYLSTSIGKVKSIKVHVVVSMIMLRGNIPENLVVDHIDCNKLNNNASNLRIVSYSENSLNLSGPNKRSTTKLLSVYKARPGRYRVKFNINGVRYDIGTFWSLQEALSARDDAYARLLPSRLMA